MPRFVTVQLQCDWADCSTVGEEGDDLVTAMTVAIDNKAGKEFLVCKQHRETIDEILLPLLQKGVKVEAPSPKRKSPGSGAAPATGQPSPAAATGGGQKAENVACKVTGCDRTLHNRTGMAQHVIRTHNYPSLAAYEAEFGTID